MLEKSPSSKNQSSVVLDYSALLLPTIHALADRPNTLVIAVFGDCGAILSPDIPIPANVRVADYVPFDDILPYCAVFVGNGGYGSVQHSVVAGTPLVVAGEMEDKAEMCAVAEWVWVAVNLGTGRPSEGEVRGGWRRCWGIQSIGRGVGRFSRRLSGLIRWGL